MENKVNRTLLQDKQDLIDMLIGHGLDLQDVETMAGVEFAMRDGDDVRWMPRMPVMPADTEDTVAMKQWNTEVDKFYEDLGTVEDSYVMHSGLWRDDDRIKDYVDPKDNVPDRYPCLALSYFSDGEDRFGKVRHEMLLYVYPDEFGNCDRGGDSNIAGMFSRICPAVG